MTTDDRTVDSPGFGPASYWMPARYMESAWTGHAPFASWLIAAARPRTIVELGTHSGFSFFVMAEAVRRLGLDTHLYAIDTWAGDNQAGFYGNEVYESVKSIAAEDYSESTTLIRSYFNKAVDQFGDGSIDLLHIDGRHGYDDVKEDFEIFRPKLSPRAVVIFHDTNEFQEGFGVHQFWDELSLDSLSFNFLHSHGLGVWLAGDEVSPTVLKFLQEAERDPEAMRRSYAILGESVTHMHHSLFELPRAVAELQTANAHLIGDFGHSERIRHEVEERLAGILNSPGWRVMAPLRWLNALRNK